MKTNNNIPAYRFRGYTDAWELRKLGELIDNLKGGVSITPNDYIENGYRTIPKGAVNDTGIADLSSCKNVSVDFFEKNYFSKTITGELITSLRDLVPSAPNLGRIVRIVGQFEEFIMPQGVYSLKTGENLLEDFLIAYSNCYIYRNVIQSEKNGSTQVHIRNGEFLNIKIQLPTLPEQKAIGTFFSTLDQQITLHQRKLDTLKEQKKTYLKLLFPAKEQTKPALRFQGFEDDWQEVKLGDISKMYQPQTITGSELTDEGVPVFGANGYIGYYSDSNHVTDQVTISARGEGTGTPNFVKAPVWITGNSMVINVDENKNIDKKFLYANFLAYDF
ncbi:TPA: restriction endonuclease subunit S, partial [Streptococcus suis]